MVTILGALLSTTIDGESILLNVSETIISCLAEIDWGQAILDLLATFLGFGLAILGEKITDKRKTRIATKELRELIIEELKKLYSEVAVFNVETLDVNPLKIPSWKSAINTGQLSLFSFETRKRLFSVYNMIEEFNAWCRVHTNYYFEQGKQNELLIKEIDRIKTNLLNSNSEENSSIGNVIKILEEE